MAHLFSAQPPAFMPQSWRKAAARQSGPQMPTCTLQPSAVASVLPCYSVDGCKCAKPGLAALRPLTDQPACASAPTERASACAWVRRAPATFATPGSCSQQTPETERDASSQVCCENVRRKQAAPSNLLLQGIARSVGLPGPPHTRTDLLCKPLRAVLVDPLRPPARPGDTGVLRVPAASESALTSRQAGGSLPAGGRQTSRRDPAPYAQLPLPGAVPTASHLASSLYSSPSMLFRDTNMTTTPAEIPRKLLTAPCEMAAGTGCAASGGVGRYKTSEPGARLLTMVPTTAARVV